MLDQQKGDLVFECDGCGDVLNTNVSSFEAARNILRREGWIPIKHGDIWKHYCAECK